ncbi:response regulator [Calothrix sp. UHCC 0171]|uniref:hybrid sensor histidine kinase/response regulator n=1 Tax=Calothrix sp. UHCC 0171 TaxID=3110245 RepID=UPI002B2069BF|nr:response regulator [Calothrix sp. UHCC 0171]MEA5572555.1 response regulator [Calothrix sp. UHCC 0171]
MLLERNNNYKANILVVDDTPDNLRLLSAMLTGQGYEVRKALNGKMALTACQMLLPDVILLDINMPGMDGYEVCQQLKANEQTCGIPVIFISALDDVLDKVKAFDVGGVDYITKPFHGAEVVLRIENQINLRLLQIRLQEKNFLLQKAFDDLKIAQVQQIQNEKMIALGQLVAGVAHEINNPVSFIYGNLQYANQYVQDLLNLINIYQQEYPEPTPKVQAKIQEIDLNFVVNDLQNLMNAMYRGADRIREIVISLQNFSRFDEAKMKSVNIHQGIDNTLIMLEHRLNSTAHRPAIAVVKNYDTLPLVTCFPGELNQVFMHILNNAIDALEMGNGAWRMGNNNIKSNPIPDDFTKENLDTNLDSNNTRNNDNYPQYSRNQSPDYGKNYSRTAQSPLTYTQSLIPQIHIQTRVTDMNTIKISISDNGPGIDESVRSRVFDPFFTTKPVGKGTGLGLSISYQIIVQKHQGTLTCNSTRGEGSNFIIEIPIQQ